MVSNRCKIVVKEILQKMNLHFVLVDLGEIDIMEDLTLQQRELLKNDLLESGLDLMDDKKAILIEKIKTIIIQMIHHSDEDIKINFSIYLNDKLQQNYNYLANLFSEVQGITIERFIINHKVEKIKEFIIYDEITITEIAHRMNYSSAAHLSTQFKKVTGLTPSKFRQLKEKSRKPLDEIAN
jgi:AraC-like DNA-binding protein